MDTLIFEDLDFYCESPAISEQGPYLDSTGKVSPFEPDDYEEYEHEAYYILGYN